MLTYCRGFGMDWQIVSLEFKERSTVHPSGPGVRVIHVVTRCHHGPGHAAASSAQDCAALRSPLDLPEDGREAGDAPARRYRRGHPGPGRAMGGTWLLQWPLAHRAARPHD